MAVERAQNWLSQQRGDVPYFRSIESGVAGDFDVLAGNMLAGQRPLVVNGFYVVTTGITAATDLQLQVAGSALINFYASESGSIFRVPTSRANEQLNTVNPKVVGSWLSGAVNFIGIDLKRSSDPTTADLVQFLDPNSLLEGGKVVPLARTLDYVIYISATDFDAQPNLVPIAKVTLDGVGNITSIQDARNIFGRLGSGGTVPNVLNTYAWPNGRSETSSSDPFAGGDKAVGSVKEWADAVMTRCWEVGGGEFWYSPTTDHNVVLARSGSVFVSSGEYFTWDGTNLLWQGLTLLFANSTATFNDIANQTSNLAGTTDLVDGDCIYVDVDRTTNRTGGTALVAAKAPLATIGSPTVPGSRWVIAWRKGSSIFTRDQSYPVMSAFKNATTAAAGMVKLSASGTGSPSPATVATTDNTSFLAYAAGLTRGSDFYGGAGNITIGGGASDQTVVLQTTRSQDEVQVLGVQQFNTNFTAALKVENSYPFDTGGHGLTMRLTGYNGAATRTEDAHHFETNGALGWRAVTGGVANPINTTSQPIIAKEYYQSNGLSTPNQRYQKVIMWQDGSTTVIAEGPAF